MDMTSKLGLVVLNTSSIPIFRRPGYRQTIIDVSLTSKHPAERIDLTGSDHQYITFRMNDVKPVP